MNYRRLGKTGLMVSEIGLGAEWLERHNEAEVKEIIDLCGENGINILDCWMPEPKVRTNIGKAIRGKRDRWIIQGHLGSTWQEGQYVRSRELPVVKEAFQDLLERLETDYIDLGMIHYVDSVKEYRQIMDGEFIEYVKELKEKGVIRHIGMSTHNPDTARLAAESGHSGDAPFQYQSGLDMMPATDNLDNFISRRNTQRSWEALPRRGRSCTGSASRGMWGSRS